MVGQAQHTGELTLASAMARNALRAPDVSAVLSQLATDLDAASATRPNGVLNPEAIAVRQLPDGSVHIVGVELFSVHELMSASCVHPAIHYVSPEHALGLDPVPASYEFSLAALAYEMLAGEKAFPGRTTAEVLYLVCASARPRRADRVNVAVSSSVGEVLQRGLAADPGSRYQSCTGFVEALASAMRPKAMATAVGATHALPEPQRATVNLPAPRRRHVEPEDLPTPQRAVPKNGRRLRAILFVCAALLLLAGAALFWRRAPTLPVQVLDTRDAPSTPAPGTPARRVPPSQPVARGEESTAQRRVAPQPDFYSSAEIVSDPPGARVVVDGDSEKGCIAPCTLSLGSGRHTIAADLSGYEATRRILDVKGNSSLFLPLTRITGTLIVTSALGSGHLLVDGKASGETPATLHLAPGRHEVTIVRDGQQRTEVVDVEADAIQAKSFE